MLTHKATASRLRRTLKVDHSGWDRQRCWECPTRSRCKTSSLAVWKRRSRVICQRWTRMNADQKEICVYLRDLRNGSTPMKLVAISLVSWMSGLLLIMSKFFVVEGQALSATVTSMIMAALLFSLAYAPSLSWLRQRLGGCRPALLFPLASAVVLNLPVFLIEILAIGRTLSPYDALACIMAFLLMGTVFGLGFVWNYQDATI